MRRGTMTDFAAASTWLRRRRLVAVGAFLALLVLVPGCSTVGKVSDTRPRYAAARSRDSPVTSPVFWVASLPMSRAPSSQAGRFCRPAALPPMPRSLWA